MPRPGIHPWDKMDGESPAAHEGFRVYRDLGPSRSIAKAAQLLGKPAPVLEGWSNHWAWETRAMQYDAFGDQTFDTQKTKAALRELGRLGGHRTVKWLRIREEELERALENGRKLVKQGEYLAAFPVVKETLVAPDGSVKTYEPADPRVLVAGARIMQVGTQMIFEAVDGALKVLGLPLLDAEPAATSTLELTDERVAEAARKVRDLRATLAREALSLPTAPPPPQQPPAASDVDTPSSPSSTATASGA